MRDHPPQNAHPVILSFIAQTTISLLTDIKTIVFHSGDIDFVIIKFCDQMCLQGQMEVRQGKMSGCYTGYQGHGADHDRCGHSSWPPEYDHARVSGVLCSG